MGYPIADFKMKGPSGELCLSKGLAVWASQQDF